MKAPPHPPLPPERVDGCKGGREGAQEILKSTQAKIRRKGGMYKEGGGPPVQADQKLQSSDNQQKLIENEHSG